MSKWYPCIYCTEDLHCTKFAEPGYESWCVLGPCPAETPSVGDMFRRMSDEELAAWLADHPVVSMYDGSNPQHKAWLDWLRKEAADDKP